MIIFLIFLLAAGLRLQETVSHNFLFLLDQGRDMLAVKSIIYDHHLTLIGPYTSLQGVFQGPLWYYLLAIPTFIFNGDPWGAVVLMFLISIGVVIITYLWTKKIFGIRAAIFTAFLFAVSPEAVAASTYAWNPHPMWILVILYIFSFYELVGLGKQRFHLAVWPLIALMFHFQTALAVFILIGSIIFLLIFNRAVIGQKKLIYGIGIAVILFMPQILFDLRHNFLMTKSVLNIFLGHDQGLFVGGENRNYLNLIRTNISLFYYNFTTTFVRDGHLKDFPRLALFIIVLSLLLQKRFKVFAKLEWRFLSVAVRLVSIIAILSFFYPFPLRYWFLTGFQGMYLVVLGLILSKIWRWLIGKIGIIIFAGLILFYSGERLYNLYVSPPNDGGVAKIKGQINAIDYIYKDAKQKKFNLLIFVPPVNTDPYDYLIWWYGGRKYKYFPKKEKKGLFYLLIEPDYSKPWSYKGWLETVIKTGKILETKELPSGFIIQKRIEDEKNAI